jgi:hypothetical protein
MYSEKDMSVLRLWLALSEHAFWWQPYDGICFCCEPPQIQQVDSSGRLHREDGPAMLCRDGWPLYMWHGTSVPQHVIERPNGITPNEIDSEQNAEVRRVMLERFGESKYLLLTARKTHSDTFGNLYRRELRDDETLVMLQALNSTPESDGKMTRDEALTIFDRRTPVCHDGMMMELSQAPASLRFKTYMLRVPPETRTAHEAAAWLGWCEGEEYNPAFQS